LADAEVAERSGEPADVVEQVLVGDRASIARLTLPVIGDPVPMAGHDVAVEALDAGVETPAAEPAGEGQVPLQNLVEGPIPAQVVLGLAAPEAVDVGLG